MKLYTIDKPAMKAIRTILTESGKKAAGSREWTKYAYLYGKGLILTDGARLLRVSDPELQEEFSSFIQETGRCVVFSLAYDSLKMEYDLPLNDSEVGTMERLIPSKEKFYGANSMPFTNKFAERGKANAQKGIDDSMLNASILASGHWFRPDSFKGMGVRPWERVFCRDAVVSFLSVDGNDAFVSIGTCWEGV